MKPVSSLPHDEAAHLRGLFFDLDDTVLTRGVLTRCAYDALWNMHDAGLVLVAVTGRPFGWAEVIAVNGQSPGASRKMARFTSCVKRPRFA